MAQKKIGAFITLDGEKQFKQAVTDCNKSLSAMKSEMALVKAETDGQANALESLQKKHTVLEKVLDTQKEKESAVKEALDHANESYKNVGEQLEKYRSDLDKAQTSLDDMKNSSSATSDEIEKQEKAVKELTDAVSKGEETYSRAGNRVKDWETKLNTARAQVIKANTELNKNAAYMKEAENATDQCATSIDAFGKKVSDSSESVVKFGEIVKANLATAAIDKTKNLVLSAASGALELESAQAQFRASTALSTDELERYNSVLDDLYKDNFGDSYNDVAEVMGVISQYTKETDPDVIKKMAENAMTLDDVFKMDVSETIRGADALVKSMGTDSEEAFDLIAVGAQNGLDKSGELVDNLAEYAPLWAQSGFEAKEMFAILQNGLDTGAYNLDKVNDYVKEFGNSLADGRIGDNLNYFSDETKNLFYNWKNGKATTKDVFYSVIKDLSTMTNKQEALTIASNTWSSLGEDNAMDVITSLNKVNTAYDDVHGAMEKIKEIKYDTLESKYESLGRTFKSEIMKPVLEDFFPVAEDGIELLTDNVEKIIPVLEGVAAGFGAFKVGSVIATTVSAVKSFTTATEVAATAQTVLNTASLANPYVAVAAVLTGVAVTAVGLFNASLEETITEEDKLVDKAAEVSDSLSSVTDSMRQSVDGWSDDQATLEAHGQVAQDLSDKLFVLRDSYDGSTESKIKMRAVVEQLNQLFPELALAIDEETGALNMSDQAIKDNIESTLEMQKVKAAQEKQTEIVKELTDAEVERTKALSEYEKIGGQITELEKKKADAIEKSKDGAVEYNGTMLDLSFVLGEYEGKISTLKSAQEGIKEEVKSANDAYADSYTVYEETEAYIEKQVEKCGELSEAYGMTGEAATEGAETVNTALQLQTEYFGDASETALTSAATIADTYEDIKESVTGALESQMDMFSAFDKGTKLSTDEMLQNMQSQIDGVENWSENLEILAERGINENLLQYLAEMGPQGAGYVATFVEMGSTELEKASELWSQSLDIKGGVSEKISGMMEEVTTAVSGGTEQVQSILQQCGYDSITGLVNGVTEYLGKVEDAGMEIGDTVVGATKTALDSHSPSVVMEGIGQDASVGLSNGILSKIGSVQNSSEMVANYALSAITSILQNETFYGIGQNVTQGLAKGILDGQSAVVNAVASMCASAVTEARKDLDINSPSKVFEEIGMYSAQGFGGGFENEMVSVAQSVRDSMNFESTEKVYSAQNTDTGNLENTIENALYNGLIYAMSKVNMAPNLNGLTVIGQYDGENVVKIVVNADESEKARTGGIGLFA